MYLLLKVTFLGLLNRFHLCVTCHFGFSRKQWSYQTAVRESLGMSFNRVMCLAHSRCSVSVSSEKWAGGVMVVMFNSTQT